MTGTAVGAAAAAGGFPGLPVTDHAAQDQPDHPANHEDQHNIDQICRKPRKRKITSFREAWRHRISGAAVEKEKEETGDDYFTLSFWDSL